MKKIILLALGIFSSLLIMSQGIPVDTYFFGLNFWNANQDNDFDSTEWQKIDNSGCNSMRFGGNGASLTNPIITNLSDTLNPIYNDTIYKEDILDRFNAHNKKGFIQLPYRPWHLFKDQPEFPALPYETDSTHELAYWADEAYKVVLHLKNNGYPGLTYSVANEPDACLDCSDNKPKGYDYSLTPDSTPGGLDSIIAYVQAFSKKIKQADPTAKVAAPTISYYRKDALEYLFKDAVNNLGDTISGTGTPADGKFFVDIISFNWYNSGVLNCDSATRQQIIDYPENTFAPALQEIIDEIIIPINRDATNMKIALTEYNLGRIRCDTTGEGENGLKNIDMTSFIGGQWFASMMAAGLSKGSNIPNGNYVQGMYIWSIKENNPDRGILISSDNKERSSYWHFQMMAQNFKGKFLSGTVSDSLGNIKAFASQRNNQIAVMILNQNTNTGIKTVKISFNDSTCTGSGINVNFPAGLNKCFTDTIGDQSTLLLIFDGCANPYRRARYNIKHNTDSVPPKWTLIKNHICRKISFASLKCPTTGNGVHQFNSIILNNSTTISDSASISGILTVPNNITLEIDNAEILFAENSKIKVLPGGKLIINNSFLHGCNGKNWEGIDVNGNNNIAGQLIIERSTITDAIVAVKTDKTNEIFISENIFQNGTTALDMNKNKGFTVRKNQFSDYEYGIKTKNTIVKESIVQENAFYNVKYALYFEDDNHSKMDIKCNKFENYSEYAILSINTTLKDQGNVIEGAGNEFISASIQVNDKLFHQGNTMKYFYEPSNPITAGMNVQTMQSQGEGCLLFAQRLGQEEFETENYNLPDQTFSGERIFIENIPNPVNDETTFNYYIPQSSGSARIKIMNLLGSVVAAYPINSGSNTLKADCSSMQGGIYFYTLEIDGNPVRVNKMVVAK